MIHTPQLLCVLTGMCISACISVTVITVNVDTSRVAAYTSDYFLSVTIDAGVIGAHLTPVQNFNPPRLLNMAKELAPAVWRLGGTDEDYIIFNRSSNAVQDFDALVLNEKQWDMINAFSRDAGWHLIYGLSALIRAQDGKWNPSNAEELFKYTSSKGYTVSWELGNEPDLFSGHSGANVTASQLAADFKTLRSILNRYDGASVLNDSFHVRLAGPDTATLNRENYFQDFLKELGDGVIDAVTWHHYYENGQKAKVEDFYDPVFMDSLVGLLDDGQKIAKQYSPSSEVWLGETSSCSHGGAPNISNTFVAGNLWLDKLGLAALYNYTAVCRQTYVGGNYGLLDRDLYPLPDYFTSVLYKRLVGPRVLSVKGGMDPHRIVRVYAHCSNPTNYPKGHVTFIVINLLNETVQLMLADFLIEHPMSLYLLTPGDGGIQSKQMMLNGNLLELENDNVPQLPSKQIAAQSDFFFPPHSYGYIVTDAAAKACT